MLRDEARRGWLAIAIRKREEEEEERTVGGSRREQGPQPGRKSGMKRMRNEADAR